MTIGTTKHPAVGERVQVPAYLDIWMRGARYGEVARVQSGMGANGPTLFGVKMDHPQVKRLIWCKSEDCTAI